MGRALAAIAAIALCGCAARAPTVDVVRSCAHVDTSALRRCDVPPLPDSDGDAVLTLWHALQLCVDAARAAIEQIEADVRD